MFPGAWLSLVGEGRKKYFSLENESICPDKAIYVATGINDIELKCEGIYVRHNSRLSNIIDLNSLGNNYKLALSFLLGKETVRSVGLGLYDCDEFRSASNCHIPDGEKLANKPIVFSRFHNVNINSYEFSVVINYDDGYEVFNKINIKYLDNIIDRISKHVSLSDGDIVFVEFEGVELFIREFSKLIFELKADEINTVVRFD